MALSKCIHPLDIKSHAANTLVNIYTGEESEDNGNVNKAREIGTDQMKKFQESLPEGFRERLSSKVVTMTVPRGKKKKNGIETFNTDLIFSSVLYLLGTNQLDFSTLFNFGLAPFPTALFDDSGDARYPKSKAVLMNSMKVEISTGGITLDTVLVDGGGMLHAAVYWPKEGYVIDLAKGIEQYVGKMLCGSDVCIIFDRYHEKSIKSDTRLERVGAFRRSHQLANQTGLPPKDVYVVSKNKRNFD